MSSFLHSRFVLDIDVQLYLPFQVSCKDKPSVEGVVGRGRDIEEQDGLQPEYTDLRPP